MLNLTKNFFKFLKKSAVVSLCAVMTVVAIPGINAFAAELNTNDNEPIANNERDIYSEKFEETVSIDGISYTYKYYYNENGDRSISILNNKTSTVEIVTCDAEASNIYLDGEKVAEVQTVDDVYGVSNSVTTRSKRSTKNGFKCLGTHSKKINLIHAISAGAVAALFAAAMSGVGVLLEVSKAVQIGLITASCGGGVLAAIVTACKGGTLYWTVWRKNTRLADNYKIDWAFNDSGDRYGTYHYYYSLK